VRGADISEIHLKIFENLDKQVSGMLLD
jgi:hypothetical protein